MTKSLGLKDGKIKSLDQLRGFLAICVVIYHIPQISRSVGLPHFSELPIFNRGTEAVLVFFTLSGYFIIGLLYDEKECFGSINIKNFYLRRILRLYPVYYLVLTFGFVFYHFLLPLLGIPFETNYNLLEAIVLNVAFLPNVFKTLYEPGSILLVLWSIGIEEQFYLLTAPLLALLALNRYAGGLLLFTLVYFILFHTSYFSFLKDYSFYYYFMSAGGTVAVLSRNAYVLSFKSSLARLGVYFVFLLHFSTDWFQFGNEYAKGAFEVILFCVLIVNLAVDDKRFEKFRFMQYLGKISYGIYMYHMIVVNFVLFLFLKLHTFFDLSSITLIILINLSCLLGTFFVSHFSFKYFESYFLHFKYKFRA
ncbi:acyltransferase family protein [Labilibaculum antarcticum]|uniref:acyltransferase family protein n=1 Tax=Labilibaculum antarcticum TaxID=1717717 RepID=UPI000BBB35DF|nr:acyltransferase [Labilibaculum antarcticum]